MEASRTGAVSTAALSGRHDREHDDDLAPRGIEAFAAEFIGTLLLVFFIGLVVSLNSAAGLGVTDFSVIGLVHFFVLAVLIHTLGGASGAHFNPAVTVTLAALRKIGPVDALVYIVLQVAGAVAGALLVKLLVDNEGEAVGYGAVEISDRFLEGDILPGFLAELIGTFILMWAIMGVAVNRQGARDWAGLVIGGALGLAVMTIAPLTGAGFNPARAFGPNLVAGDAFSVFDGAFFVTYVLGPLVGALLAGVLYTALVINPQRGGRGTGRRPVDTLSGREESRRDEGGPGPAADVARPVDRLE